MSRLNIKDVRSEALFASDLQRSDQPTAGEVRATIAAAIRRHGSRGCAALMAQEFGDEPDSAAARMLWARALVTAAYPAADPVPASGPLPDLVLAA